MAIAIAATLASNRSSAQVPPVLFAAILGGAVVGGVMARASG